MRSRVIPVLVCLIFAPGVRAERPFSLTLGKPKEPDAPAVKKLDLHGDPLPAGADLRLGTIRLRHPGPTVLAWAPDGKLMASGGIDERIRLWDPTTGKEVRQMKAASVLSALVFSSDGKTLISGEAEGSIRLWDVASGREIRRLGNPKERVTRLALSPDSRSLYSIGPDRAVRQWLVASGLEVSTIPAHNDNILALTVTPDGKELRTAAADHFVRVFDTATGKETRRFRLDSTSGPYQLTATFSRSGRLLAATRADGILSVYDTDSGALVRSLARPVINAQTVDFSPNDKFIALAHSGRGVWVFGVASGLQVRFFDQPSAFRWALAYAPDGQTLAGTAGDFSLRLWNVGEAREAVPTPGHVSAIQSMCFSRDGSFLVTASKDGDVRVWDRATGKQLAQLKPRGYHYAVLAGTEPRTFLEITPFGAMVEWALSDKHELTVLRRWQQDKTLRDMSASADSKRLAATSSGTEVFVVDQANGEILHKIDTKGVRSGLTLSPDGTLLAAYGFAGAPVHVWNAATGQLVRTFKHRGASKLAFSPDSKLLAVADPDIRLYELATGQERQHTAQGAVLIRALAFSHDGRHIVASFLKGGVQRIDVASGLAVTFGDAAQDGGEVAISPDGATLATACTDASVLLWAKPFPHRPKRPIAVDRLEPADVDLLWKSLAADDGRRVHQAIWALAGAPEQSVPFIKERLKPAVFVDPKQVDQYIRDLDSASFERRQKAMRVLEDVGDPIEQPLRAAMLKSPSLEFRRRADEVLNRLKEPSPQRLQTQRAVEVLEHAASDEAHSVLAALAEGGAGNWLTIYARQARDRLRQGQTPRE